MQREKRKDNIIQKLQSTDSPVSASSLAKELADKLSLETSLFSGLKVMILVRLLVDTCSLKLGLPQSIESLVNTIRLKF